MIRVKDHSDYFNANWLVNHSFFKDELTAKKAIANYLKEMAETKEQAIERLNLYCIVPWFTNVFDYLDDILLLFTQGKYTKYREINTVGARMSGKTYKIVDFALRAAIWAEKNGKRVAFYGLRLFNNSVNELFKTVNQVFQRYGLVRSNKADFSDGDYKLTKNQNTPFFEFKGGSFFHLAGVYKANDRTVAFKGLAPANGADLAIVFHEEANEFSNGDVQAVRAAVRGAKHVYYLNASNPDVLYQQYIQYCNANLTFNKQVLIDDGQQFKMFVDTQTTMGKIFHITNYRINPYVSQNEAAFLLELEKHDPKKYNIWGIGMPGGLETSVFSSYMDEYEKDFIGNRWVAGVDLGFSNGAEGHPTKAILSEVGQLSSGKPRMHPIGEYTHSNATMSFKSPFQIAQDIVQFFIDEAEFNVGIKRQGLSVQVDYGGGGLPMIDNLNMICRQRYDADYNSPVSSWLSFTAVDKSAIWFIKDRITITQDLLSRKILTMSTKDTPELYKEMELIQYKKQVGVVVNSEPQMIDYLDDGWDALCYSLMPIVHILTASFRESELYSKQYKKINTRAANDPDSISW